MRPLSILKEQITPFHLGLIIVSGLMWVALWHLNRELAQSTIITSGIALVFLPAGFRLLLILLFGPWGAVGIFLFEPILFATEFGQRHILEILTSSAISGFSPLLVVTLFCRAAGIQRSLSELRPIHLPLLSLAVSAFTPLLFNLYFTASGLHPAADFARNYTAMATGDFLGCLIVMAFIKSILMGLRTLRRLA